LSQKLAELDKKNILLEEQKIQIEKYMADNQIKQQKIFKKEKFIKEMDITIDEKSKIIEGMKETLEQKNKMIEQQSQIIEEKNSLISETPQKENHKINTENLTQLMANASQEKAFEIHIFTEFLNKIEENQDLKSNQGLSSLVHIYRNKLNDHNNSMIVNNSAFLMTPMKLDFQETEKISKEEFHCQTETMVYGEEIVLSVLK
jgi:hypothetical protein